MSDERASRARYRRILRFALRYMVQAWWYELFLPRVGLSSLAARGRPARLQHIARHFHALAVQLGGLMIKVGQFMSSRLDVLPPEITRELEGLQDEVPPVAFDEIRALAEAELGVPLDRAFAQFDPLPLAAASLGQAHRAALSVEDAGVAGFTNVVVKVQRPGIDRVVAVDLAALRKVAGWLHRVQIIRRHVDLPVLMEEFARTSLEEIDYLHEAGSAERFAADFADDGGVSVPAVAWERTTRQVLTLADVTAIKINDVDALRAAGIDPGEVATEFARVMFDQLFDHGFFHADPHPGNIFVTPTPDAETERTWRFTFIDFGMMGEVPDRLRDGLRRVLIAVAARDGRRLVESMRDVGVLLPDADTTELERAMTTLFARFGGMGFAELAQVDPREFEDFAREFGDTIRRMPTQLPENFLLIIRTVSLTSGVCSSLDPAFNVWDAVEPYAQRLLREESGNVVQAFATEVRDVLGIAVRLPRRLDDVVTRLEDGRLAVDTPKLDKRIAGLERAGRRVVAAIIFAGLLIGGILMRLDDIVFGTVLMIASIVPLAHAVLAGLFSRRF
ncbi:AarF/ABC1/UbiB kinase family protein [Microbacterium sp. C7(2022)]|uniref:ABC1 kinase family protein n=1 Tax=Microbacterium sp. C7(2022) TaxID=2992759 RepID=UPI00237C08BC|nr:AarF/UbiB family protein [Microbacterium sp. C7(2022)]MDE0546051.1 AarF/UbiB family protein [Microbacterium sp. C7(2022)]